MNRNAPLVFAVSITWIAPPESRASPDVGDQAPKVQVARWYNGAPPALPGGDGADKHVFLVEFWATWCPPCAKSIPHLAKLHEKHRQAGLVILGITNEEPETVAPFVKRRKMPYHVGIDDDMATNNKWTDDIETIPHAFIVDRQGRVVWSGNPLDTDAMDKTIEQVLAGKHDLDKARAAAAEGQRRRKYVAIAQQLQMARAAGEKDRALEIVDRMIKLTPDSLHPWLIKRNLLIEFGRPTAARALDDQMEAALKDSLDGLFELVTFELQRPMTDRDAKRLWRTAARLRQIDEGDDPDILAALARVR